jgi:hypothetical protein
MHPGVARQLEPLLPVEDGTTILNRRARFTVCSSPSRQMHLAMGKARILAEFWQFLRVRKKYWLLPIVVVLVLLSLLIVLTQGSALAPFIYALF